MGKVNNITKVFLVLVVIVGAIALTLLIVGVASRKWLTVSSGLSTIETALGSALTDTTFITSLIAATQANQTQVVQIILAVAGKVEEVVSGAVATRSAYHLYGKTPNVPKTSPTFKPSQGLVFAGIATFFVGLLLAIIITLLPLSRVIRLVPLILLIVGPLLIILGCVIYPKKVVEDFGTALELQVDIGFSVVLVVVGAIIGFITAAVFAFIILQQRQNLPNKTYTVGLPPPRSMFRPSYRPRANRKP
ncbi:unnamed protein product [Adineta ricciae]|uniref:Uncharacterized protein n=1 Tax=Adineta ricciae TaxID=249248 RepID=A0A814Q2M5_ADIRI|nr:unnamed protein product [Adineta ricciae]CAF1499012.1 unnamed protein product [Adineta ricciae]